MSPQHEQTNQAAPSLANDAPAGAAAAAELRQALLACGPLKVWSVAITILGDACQSREDRITGRGFDRLMQPLGITNQALRVALHRLKRDGWIEAERQGRSSAYRLSDQGWASTEAVRPRIYGFEPPRQQVWLAMAPPELSGVEMESQLPEEALRLSPRTALVTQGAETLEGWLLSPVSAGAVPDWLRDSLLPAELIAEYRHFCRSCPEPEQLQALAQEEQQILRLLTLHHWRRLRLRHGDLPDLLLQKDWIGATVADKVQRVLDTLPRADLTTLNAG